MNDLISREETLTAFADYVGNGMSMDDFDALWNIVTKMPSVNPQEQIAQERYEDLCEYFGEAKDILKNRDDFKAWLARVKWHIRKAEELYRKYEQEPKTDTWSIKDVADTLVKHGLIVEQEPETGHCKDCKYFEYDSVAKVEGIPLIVAHEICNKWGDGCKTKEDGYCFLFEPQESEVMK